MGFNPVLKGGSFAARRKLLAHDGGGGVAPSPWAQLFVVFLVADGLAQGRLPALTYSLGLVILETLRYS